MTVSDRMRFVEDAYALVSAPGARRRKRLRLPVLVGSSPACDVIVNSDALPPLGYVVYSERGALRVFHGASSRDVPLRSLGELGIEIVGPITGEASGRQSRARSAYREFLAREAAAFGRLPRVARTALLGSLPQKPRLAVWTATTIFAFGAISGVGREAPTLVDLANSLRPMAFDAVLTETVGASPKNPDFVKGYEKGVSFALEVPEDAAGQAHLMSFDVAGLNLGRELVLRVNDKLVLQTEAEGACAQDACTKTLRLDPGLLRPGSNVLAFEHTRPESSYFLARLHVRRLPPIKVEESQQAERWLEIAERAYAERQIVTDNVVTAGRFAEQALKLARERDGTWSLAGRAAALKNEIQSAHLAIAKELWDEVAVKERLERSPEAEQALNQLLRLYPDASSPEHAKVRAKLEDAKGKSR